MTVLLSSIQPGSEAVKPLITGVACRFPGVTDSQELWQNLLMGVENVGQSRWPKGFCGIPRLDSLIADVHGFDAQFFGVTDEKADHMNVHLRHLVEVTYECLVDSALWFSHIQQANTGIYVACNVSEADSVLTSDLASPHPANTSSQFAGYLKELFHLSGPAIMYGASHLAGYIALQAAVTDLKLGHCDHAIVAGGSLVLSPAISVQMKDVVGHEAFKGRSDGFVALMLSRTEKECRRVYCRIEGMSWPACTLHTELTSQYPSTISNAGSISAVHTLVHIQAYSEDITDDEGDEGNACEKVDAKNFLTRCYDISDLTSVLKTCLSLQHGRQLSDDHDHKSHTDKKACDVCRASAHVYLSRYHTTKTQDNNGTGEVYMLIPYTSRSENAVSAIEKYVCEHRDHPHVIHLLATSQLSQETHNPCRGWLMITPEGPLISNQASAVELGPICLVIEDFIWSSIEGASSLLSISPFKQMIDSCQKILDVHFPEIVLMQLLEDETSADMNILNHIVLSLCVQLGILDVFRCCGISWSYMTGSGLSEIAVAYIDRTITLEQALKVMLAIGKHMNTLCQQKQDKDSWCVYEVDIPCADAFMLRFDLHVLSILSKQTVVLAIKESQNERFMDWIKQKDFGWKLLTKTSVLLYCSLLRNIATNLSPELERILVQAKHRSPKWRSSQYATHLSQVELSLQKFDSSYVIGFLTTCVQQSAAMRSMPVNHVRIHICSSDVIMMSKPCTHRTPSTMTSTEKEISLMCSLTADSLLSCLGDLHMSGCSVDVAPLYDVQNKPVGSDCPSLAPLIHWDHSSKFYIPPWTCFFSRVCDNDHQYTYTVTGDDVAGVHDPIAILIYHVWYLICQARHIDDWEERSVLFDKLVICSDLSLERLTGATIQVLPALCSYTVVSKEGDVMLQGKFDLDTEMHMPIIPGYEVDINDNIDTEHKDGDLPQTEIVWEDSWLEFVSAVLDFNSHYAESPPKALLIHPPKHFAEIANCASILTMMETYTGLCRAGGLCVMYPSVPEKDANISVTDSTISLVSDTHVTQVRLYSIPRCSVRDVSEKYLIFCSEENADTHKQSVGIILLKGGDLQEKCVGEMIVGQMPEVIVPFLLAEALLENELNLTSGQSLLILPPVETVVGQLDQEPCNTQSSISVSELPDYQFPESYTDSVCVLLAHLALQHGCQVYMSSWDIETCHFLSTLFPDVTVIPSAMLKYEIKKMTKGNGMDCVLRLAGGEMNTMLDYTHRDGTVVLCGAPHELEDISVAYLQGNITVKVTESASILRNKLQAPDSKLISGIGQFMGSSFCEKLYSEGYPEEHGICYEQIQRVTFSQPFSLQTLVRHMLDPTQITPVISVIPGLDSDVSVEAVAEKDAQQLQSLQDAMIERNTVAKRRLFVQFSTGMTGSESSFMKSFSHPNTDHEMLNYKMAVSSTATLDHADISSEDVTDAFPQYNIYVDPTLNTMSSVWLDTTEAHGGFPGLSQMVSAMNLSAADKTVDSILPNFNDQSLLENNLSPDIYRVSSTPLVSAPATSCVTDKEGHHLVVPNVHQLPSPHLSNVTSPDKSDANMVSSS